MLDHPPTKEQGLPFLFRGRSFSHHLNLGGIDHLMVKGLSKVGSSPHGPYLPTLLNLGEFGLDQPKVFLLLQDFKCLSTEGRCDDHLAEDTRNGLGTGPIQLAVAGDDASEGCLTIGCKSLFPGLQQILTLPDATGVGVLEDGEGGWVPFKLTDERLGCGQIEDVVVGKGFTMMLLKSITKGAIQGRLLVWIFTISQILGLGGMQKNTVGSFVGSRLLGGKIFKSLLQVIGNGGIIGSGAGIDFGSQCPSQFQGSMTLLRNRLTHL